MAWLEEEEERKLAPLEKKEASCGMPSPIIIFTYIFVQLLEVGWSGWAMAWGKEEAAVGKTGKAGGGRGRRGGNFLPMKSLTWPLPTLHLDLPSILWPSKRV